MRVFKQVDSITAAESTEIAAVAAGSTLGLEQSLLANAGQVGLNVLAVALTNTGKVQGVSLGAGNVVEVYTDGAAFNSGTVLYREFMAFGEPICFTGLSAGAIITSTQGFYGASEYSSGTNECSMPLLSLGLSFKKSFLFAFRHSDRTTNDHGFALIVNGPLQSTVSITYGDGSALSDQPDITLDPWEFGTFYFDGDVEYVLESTNSIMAAIATGFNSGNFDTAGVGQGAGPADARLIMPLSNDVITHPRSGDMSAPFSGTVVNYYSVDGVEGSFTVSPGSAIDIQSNTGQSNTDYRPQGFTRFKAVGVVVAHSGADGAGRDATPAAPVTAFGQIIAQPFHIQDGGNGDQTSVTIFSPYVGTAKVYEWNDTTSVLDLAYTVPLNRQGVTVAAQEDQFHPTAGQVSNEPDTGVVTLVGQLNPGVVVADVPIAVISQSNSPLTDTVRSQNGTTTTTIINDDDETLMFGITPASIAAEIREDADGILRKRTIDNTGTETWVVA
jgi:hypothetical protein